MPRLLAGLLLTTLVLAQSGAKYRPLLHFAPARNWTNDPCGLVYSRGLYHLFFQHNPFGDQWGHMSWGHATSRDGLRWEEQPVAIPEANKVAIFTGSTVEDRRNTSGLCQGSEGCLVAIYTGHHTGPDGKAVKQTQNLAASSDGGKTWVKYGGNPVLDVNLKDFRDPKVFWHEASKRWVMVLALPTEYKARFYGSPDLKKWEQLSEFGPAGATGGIWECPELFELPVDRNSAQRRWVLKIGINPGHVHGGSGEQYFVGQFDGSRFTNDNPADKTLWLDYGRDCYCALTFNNTPQGQPPTLLAWMNNWQYAGKVPTSPWRGQMTLPRQLALRTTPGGVRLTQQPVPALARRRGARRAFQAASAEEWRQRWTLQGDAFELAATVRPGSATAFGWRLFAGADAQGLVVGYDAARRELFVDRTQAGTTGFSPRFPSRTTAPLTLRDGALTIRIIVDRLSVEVFADDGLVAMTNLVFPQAAAEPRFYADGGKVAGVTAEAWPLQ